jgi:hypothetical protein
VFRAFVLSALVGCLWASGCVYFDQDPAGPDGEAAIFDESLLGDWDELPKDESGESPPTQAARDSKDPLANRVVSFQRIERKAIRRNTYLSTHFEAFRQKNGTLSWQVSSTEEFHLMKLGGRLYLTSRGRVEGKFVVSWIKRVEDRLRVAAMDVEFFEAHPGLLPGRKDGANYMVAMKPKDVRSFIETHGADKGLWEWQFDVRRRPAGSEQPPTRSKDFPLPVLLEESIAGPEGQYAVADERLPGDWAPGYGAAPSEDLEKAAPGQMPNRTGNSMVVYEFERISPIKGKKDTYRYELYAALKTSALAPISEYQYPLNQEARLVEIDGRPFLEIWSEQVSNWSFRVVRLEWTKAGFVTSPMAAGYFEAHPDAMPTRIVADSIMISADSASLRTFLGANYDNEELWGTSRDQIHYRRRRDQPAISVQSQPPALQRGNGSGIVVQPRASGSATIPNPGTKSRRRWSRRRG